MKTAYRAEMFGYIGGFFVNTITHFEIVMKMLRFPLNACIFAKITVESLQ